MQTRSTELVAFLNSLQKALAVRAQPESDLSLVTEKIMGALQVEQPAASPEPVWLPVCDFIDDAIDNVASATAEVNSAQQSHSSLNLIDHAQALRALAPKLAWWHRTAEVQPGNRFATAHANATVIGKGGLEERDDVWVGISLIAPDLEYPEHRHSPEEVYLVLSRGYWQQDGGAWFEPGLVVWFIIHRMFFSRYAFWVSTIAGDVVFVESSLSGHVDSLWRNTITVWGRLD